jgi:two-component system sensor histidine kinase CreC
MKLGLRIFFCYMAVFVLCFYWPADWIYNSLRTRYYESIEDVLVDEANILAAIAGQVMAER